MWLLVLSRAMGYIVMMSCDIGIAITEPAQ